MLPIRKFGDAASLAGHVVCPVGDVGASQNSGICDTAVSPTQFRDRTGTGRSLAEV